MMPGGHPAGPRLGVPKRMQGPSPPPARPLAPWSHARAAAGPMHTGRGPATGRMRSTVALSPRSCAPAARAAGQSHGHHHRPHRRAPTAPRARAPRPRQAHPRSWAAGCSMPQPHQPRQAAVCSGSVAGPCSQQDKHGRPAVPFKLISLMQRACATRPSEVDRGGDTNAAARFRLSFAGSVTSPRSIFMIVALSSFCCAGLDAPDINQERFGCSLL